MYLFKWMLWHPFIEETSLASMSSTEVKVGHAYKPQGHWQKYSKKKKSLDHCLLIKHWLEGKGDKCLARSDNSAFRHRVVADYQNQVSSSIHIMGGSRHSGYTSGCRHNTFPNIKTIFLRTFETNYWPGKNLTQSRNTKWKSRITLTEGK